MSKQTEAIKLALEALLWANNEINDWRDDSYGYEPEDQPVIMSAITALREALAEQPAQQEPVLQEIEQYRLQMAGISTAAIGYWKEGDGIHSAYDTVALRDVAKLYAKYDELYRAQPAQQEPVYWQWRRKDQPWSLEYTFNSEVQITTKDSERRALYISPPAQRTWVGLTDDEIEECYSDKGYIFARAIEAKLKEKNT